MNAPELRVALGASLISFAAVFVEWIAPFKLGPTAIGFWRMLLGGVLLGILSLLRSESFRNEPSALVFNVLAGLFFASDLFVWHRSILKVGTGIATLLANTQVFWVAAFSVLFLGERRGWRLWAAVLLGLAGIGALSGAFPHGDLSPARREGILCGMLTGVFYAGFVLSLRRAGQAGQPLTPGATTCVVSVVASLALGAAAGATGERLGIPGLHAFLLLLGLAFVGQFLGWPLISGSLAKVPASKGALLLLLQPLLAMVWGTCLVPQPHRLDGIQIGGAAATLAAIYLGSLR